MLFQKLEKKLKTAEIKIQAYFKTLGFFLLFFNISLNAQNKISGTIINDSIKKVENANVIIKDIENAKTLYFTRTDENGYFEIIGKIIPRKYILKISCLGYKSLEKEFETTSTNTVIAQIIIEKSIVELDEIVLEARRTAMTINGDTTKYNIDYFKNGTEDNLKDLLNRLPGITTNEKGKIIVNGKEITELLIDGENLFNRQHQLATENIASKTVKSVELYKNHTSFDKLKTDNPTEGTAINIVIKEEFKNKLKGFIQSDSNFDDRYKINASLYNFGKKNKFSLIQNSNNLGINPIGIQDYFSLTQVDEDQLTSKSSNVMYATTNDIPKFLTIDENVVKKNSDFLNVSNVYIPTIKTKINFYSLLNFSKLKENILTEQQFTNSNLEFKENKNTREKSVFGLFNLKLVHKPNESTLFKFSNSLVIDKVDNNTDLDNFSMVNPASVFQNNDSDNKIFNSNFNFSKRINKSILIANAYLNFKEVDFKNDIASSKTFLDFDFNGDYYFEQQSKNINRKIGLDVAYTFHLKNLAIDLKTAHISNSFYSNNFSTTHADYKNFYKTRDIQTLQEIGLNYKIAKITNLNFNLNYNQIDQKINDLVNFNTDFLGYSTSLKFSFDTNSVLQISNSLSNSLPNPEYLIENYFVKDYRTLYRNQNIKPNTIIPLHNFNINYFKFNIKSNSTLIVNANYSFSDKAINTNLRNETNYSISEYGISPKDEITMAMLFYEKKLAKIPFSLTLNLDFNRTEKKFYIDSNLSYFKSNYFSNSVSVKSTLKKSPVHFNVGYNYALTNFNNNDSENKLITFQSFLNLNGLLLKNFYWRVNSSNLIFNSDYLRRNIVLISPSLRFSKNNSNWEYYIEGHNILNLKNPEILTNPSGPGYTLQTVTGTLKGYINFGTKYKF